MPYKLVCVRPFDDRPSKTKFKKGDTVHDQNEVARHLRDREKHFVKVAMTPSEIAALPSA